MSPEYVPPPPNFGLVDLALWRLAEYSDGSVELVGAEWWRPTVIMGPLAVLAGSGTMFVVAPYMIEVASGGSPPRIVIGLVALAGPLTAFLLLYVQWRARGAGTILRADAQARSVRIGSLSIACDDLLNVVWASVTYHDGVRDGPTWRHEIHLVTRTQPSRVIVLRGTNHLKRTATRLATALGVRRIDERYTMRLQEGRWTVTERRSG
ncbi:MAG: hypothetical protein K2Y21_02715 [Phycisphaerales bacterium]|nr:hypothetical protein [Phycisphaerales bacterium]